MANTCKFSEAISFCFRNTSRNLAFAKHCTYTDDKLTAEFLLSILRREWDAESTVIRGLVLVGVPLLLVTVVANGLSVLVLRNEGRRGAAVAPQVALAATDIVTTTAFCVYGLAYFFAYPFFYHPFCFHPPLLRAYHALNGLNGAASLASLLLLLGLSLCSSVSLARDRAPLALLTGPRVGAAVGVAYALGLAVGFPLNFRGVRFATDGHDMSSAFCALFGANGTSAEGNHAEALGLVRGRRAEYGDYTAAFLNQVYLRQMLRPKTITFMAENECGTLERVRSNTPEGTIEVVPQCEQILNTSNFYVVFSCILLFLSGNMVVLCAIALRKKQLMSKVRVCPVRKITVEPANVKYAVSSAYNTLPTNESGQVTEMSDSIKANILENRAFLQLIILEFVLAIFSSSSVLMSFILDKIKSTERLFLQILSATTFILQISLNLIFFSVTNSGFRAELWRLTFGKLLVIINSPKTETAS